MQGGAGLLAARRTNMAPRVTTRQDAHDAVQHRQYVRVACQRLLYSGVAQGGGVRLVFRAGILSALGKGGPARSCPSAGREDSRWRGEAAIYGEVASVCGEVAF